MLTIVLLSLSPLLYIIATVFLIRRYLRTRDIGLLWLGVAVLVWPYLSDFIEQGELRLALHSSLKLTSGANLTPGSFYTLFQGMNHAIGAALVLCAILHIGKAQAEPESAPLPV